MSSFFIRNHNDNNRTQKRKGGKLKVYHSKKTKKPTPKPLTKVEDDEEIPSDDEDTEFIDTGKVSSDEDERLTAQEKKLKLAKQYLQEIEEEEKKKLDNDHVDNDVILGRLKQDVLSEAGKLKRKVAGEINKDLNEDSLKVLRCKEHKLAVTCIVLSSDSQFIYSGSKDGSIVKWGIDGKKVNYLPPRHKNKANENLHSSTVLALAISYDNKFLASSDENPIIQIWNPESLAHLCSFKGHRAAVTGLSFCRISQNLFSCSRDKTVKVWSMPEKAYIETLFGHHDPITSIDVLSKGRAVTSGGTDNTCRVWKIEEETQLVYNGNSRTIDSVKRLDDNHFLTCDDNGAISLWGTLKKKPLTVVKNAHGIDPLTNEALWISSIACVPNSELFASGSNDGFVRLWTCADNYRSIEELCKIPVKGFVNYMAFSADAKFLVLGVGQEHRLGRWHKVKEAKNSVVIIMLKEGSKVSANSSYDS